MILVPCIHSHWMKISFQSWKILYVQAFRVIITMLQQYNSVISEKSVYKPTETFQYTHYSSCHPPGVKKGFIKGEAIRLLRTNSSERNFQEAMCNFKTRLEARGYPKSLIEKTLSEVSFAARQSTLKTTKKLKAKYCLLWQHTTQGLKI